MPTKIEWADETWNPMVGCSKVSAGCDHCYAIRTVHRGLSEQHRGLTVVPEGQTAPEWNGQINEVPKLLDQPLRWGRPRRIFVNSLSDLFHPGVSNSYIAQVVGIMALAEQHTFQVLTKRPKRMALWLEHPEMVERVVKAIKELADESRAVKRAVHLSGWPRLRALLDGGLPNAWWGTSIESDEVAWRADVFKAMPRAKVCWVSVEPLLGPITKLDLTHVRWVVAGGESGPGARPMHPDWVRDLRDRTLDGVPPAACAFLFKQWGDWVPSDQADVRQVMVSQGRAQYPSVHLLPDGTVAKPSDLEDWLKGTHLLRVGKGKAGRLLDGRTWDEYPAAHAVLAR